MQEFIEFSLNHWLLIIAIIAVFVLIIIEENNSAKTSKSQLDPETAAIMMQKGANIFDIRDRESFKTAHIRGAKWVKYESLVDKADIVIDKSKDTILCCQDGSMSGELCEQLHKKQGIKVYFISGGITNWRSDGFTVQTQEGQKQ